METTLASIDNEGNNPGIESGLPLVLGAPLIRRRCLAVLGSAMLTVCTADTSVNEEVIDRFAGVSTPRCHVANMDIP